HRLRFAAACLVVGLVAALGLVFLRARANPAASFAGAKPYYLGLGDSLAFGYQPNFDYTHGYVYQWYADLRTRGSRSRTDYGCNGETTATFIDGGCPYAGVVHDAYSGPQLAAAIKFIRSHAGQVSPVSLDMGANDVLPDIDLATCAVSPSWEADLARM